MASLRAFAAYAETGNLTAAGERLNVTHAAISQQIRRLEDHVGLQLLERNGPRSTLSHDGERLAEALDQGFTVIAARVAEMTGTEAARPVNISVSPTFASGWLMPRLAQLQKDHPEISVMIDVSPTVRALRPGDMDIAIRHGRGDWSDVEIEPLLRAPIVVVAARSLVGDDIIDGPDDLTRYHWLHETGLNEATHWLEQHGVTQEPTRGVTALPGNMMLEAARAGQGVAILAEPFVADEIAAGRLRVLFRDDIEKSYYIATRPGVQRAAVKTVVRWLRRQKTAPSDH